jgi:gluconolactonase
MKKVHMPFVVVLAAIVTMEIGVGRAQAPSDKPAVVKLDPVLDEIISTDAKLQRVKTGFGFTEGPNWVQHGKEGYLVFSDIPGNVVYKMTPDGEVSVYLERSGYTGPFNGFTMFAVGGSTDNGPFIQLGSDGLTVDLEGRLILCAFGDRALERLEKDGKRTILADSYEGKRFNGPNDVVVKKDGAIYFSDTFSGLRDRPNDPKSAAKGLDYMGIFMIKD